MHAHPFLSSEIMPPFEVHFNGTHIQQVHNYKYLGVVISDTLSWNQHIDIICSKAAKGIGFLRLLSWFFPRQALCTMYNAYILPHLPYVDAVWGTCTQVQSSGLECIQNYAAHIILHRCLRASATDMQCELSWPTLASRRAVSEAVQYIKMSLVAVLTTSLHYFSQVRLPISMLPGLPPAQTLKLGPSSGKRHLPSKEHRGRMDFQQASELARVMIFQVPSSLIC